ncbi:MAG: hypothetical protein SRB2_01005 [Desulfobacteraceae bacterium Eth-SRB2]|nr:MAG: hypothetical protein SRB2_01005 [Desulfobacteraceae bacterium Eth-SRB2]
MNSIAKTMKEIRMLGKTALLLILFLVLVAAIPGSPAAQEEGWEYAVTPYLWTLSLDGDVKVKGRKSDVDMEFSDIWDELNMATMVVFEARKGEWGFYSNIIYANLGKATHVQGIRIEPDINLLMLTAGGFYRMGTWDLSEAPGKKSPTITVDALFGARYTYLDIELDIKGFHNPEGDENWVDPLIGVRTLWSLSDRWTLALEGSIEGFGVGSDFAWHAYGLIGYHFGLFADDDAKVLVGYRALSQDYDDGHGNDKFEWDVTLHGPIAGLKIVF